MPGQHPNKLHFGDMKPFRVAAAQTIRLSWKDQAKRRRRRFSRWRSLGLEILASRVSPMARFRAHLAATEVSPLGNSGVRLRLSVRNLSNRSWPAEGPVFLAYQVLDGTAGSLLAEGERTPFGREVPPGEETQATLTIELPPECTSWQVLVSPVEDPVAWFHERGSDCLVLQVDLNAGGEMHASHRLVTSRGRRWETARRRAHRLLTAPFAMLARRRALITSMVRRDVHGRYRGSVAGLFWTLIHPLLLMLTYFFIFALVLKVRFGPGPEAAGPANFLLYFVCGMLPWLAFNEAMGRAASVVLEHRTLVTRVLFPVEILPVNIAIAGLVGEFFALLIFLAALLSFQGGIPATALYLPLVVAPQLMLTIGLCWFLAALGVFLRDTGQFMLFLLTLWFFATPICYPESALPAQALWLFEKNPMYVLVRAYRAIFLENSPPAWKPLLWLWAGGFAAFIFGFAWFHRSRRSFADVL